MATRSGKIFRRSGHSANDNVVVPAGYVCFRGDLEIVEGDYSSYFLEENEAGFTVDDFEPVLENINFYGRVASDFPQQERDDIYVSPSSVSKVQARGATLKHTFLCATITFHIQREHVEDFIAINKASGIDYHFEYRFNDNISAERQNEHYPDEFFNYMDNCSTSLQSLARWNPIKCCFEECEE
eukprot:UC1_evm3s126